MALLVVNEVVKQNYNGNLKIEHRIGMIAHCQRAEIQTAILYELPC